jgi:hypothetical protein
VWRRDATVLSSDTRVKISASEDGTYTLMIQDAIMTDAATYSIEASNEVGVKKSSAKISMSGKFGSV